MILLREFSSRQIVCTANSVRGPRGLAPPECNDDAAGGNQRPTHIDGHGGRLVESDLGQHLGYQEKQHNIYTKQLTKIPRWAIDRESIKCEHDCAGDEKKHAGRAFRAIHAALKERVSED